MICTKIEQDNTLVLRLEGDLLITDVVALREDILSGLTGSDKIVLDMADVGEIDTAGVQLLLAAVRSADERLSLRNNEEVLKSASQRIGLNPAEFFASASGGK